MILGFSAATTHHEHEVVGFLGSGAVEKVPSVLPPTAETLQPNPSQAQEIQDLQQRREDIHFRLVSGA